MAESDLVRLVVAPLEALEIPYLVTGGVAAVIYGEPRFTRSVDIVLDRHLRDVAAMLELSGEAVAWDELDPWLVRLELGPLLDEARGLGL